MKRSTFSIFVVALVAIIVYIFWSANRLPASLLTRIQDEQRQLADAKSKVAADNATVAREAAADPILFQVGDFDQKRQAGFSSATAALNDADRYASSVDRLRQQNSRRHQHEIEDLLARESDRRAAAINQADAVLKDTQSRVDLKKNFAPTMEKVASTAHVLSTTDYTWLEPKIEKAEKDWPAKKDDLAARLTAVTTPRQEAAKWEASAKALETKPAASLNAQDYAQAIQLQDEVAHAPTASQARDLDALRGQLYTSWDDVLVDLDKGHDEFREHIKHVITVVPAPGAAGTTSSNEYWKDVDHDQWKLVENDLGMAVAHKPTGKYDSEADHVPEPAEFAYMASPAEGRNQYGYWENHGGDSLWHWLPEYLILRDLLSNHHYVPVPVYDWNRYYDARRYGQTWYGHDVDGAPKYGSHGTFTQQRYGSSRYVQSGGFSGSKYSSGGGVFAGPKSPSAGTFGSAPGSSAGKKFGSSSSGHTFGGAPSKSFGSRSMGRSFGGGRRR